MTTTTTLSHDMLTIDSSTKLAKAENKIDETMTTRCIQETMRVYHLAALIAQAGADEQRVAGFIEAVQKATWTLGLLVPVNVDDAGQSYGSGRLWLGQTATEVRKLHALTTLAVHRWYNRPAENESDARAMIVDSTASIRYGSVPRKVATLYDVADIVSTLDSAACIVDAATRKEEARA